MDIPQGNRISAEVLDRLEIGMTRNQVRFLLGTPAIEDPYNPDQWIYVYYLKDGATQAVVERNMTLLFTGDLLTSVEGSLNPS